jgi:DNA-binding winged helix-turn-helix (wHTH) protein/TolB-like protein/tetratricopeptide (TPR) repeat protein
MRVKVRHYEDCDSLPRMGAATMDTPAFSAMFQFDRFRLQGGGGRLLRQDTAGAWRPVSIGSRALAVLGVLIEQRGTLVSKDEIMRAVWPGTVVEEHNLTVQISTLRRLLDEDHPSESCIQTVIGRGYRFQRPMMTLCPDGDPLLESSMHGLRPSPNFRPRLSLIVLPLKYFGDEPGGVAMAETITNELTVAMSGWSFACVIAGGSTETRELDPLRAGKALGAGYVVHGSIRRTSLQTRVNIGLIDVETGAHLWAEQFDADHEAIADVHDEITGRLARSLVRKLIGIASSRLEALQPGDWTTYDHDIRGRAMAMLPSSLTNRQAAIYSFERVLALDPGSVGGRIGMAAALIGNILDGWSTSIQQDEARAERLLLEVLRGNADISRAHAYMGMLRRCQGRLFDSRLELEIAVAMDPRFALAMGQLGLTLVYLGLPRAAIAWLERSLRLAPHDDTATPVDHAALGLCHLMLNDCEEALIHLRKARAGNPRLFYVHLWLAAGLGLAGEVDEASSALRQGVELKPEIVSISAVRARWPIQKNAQFIEMWEKTVMLGLRRAGLPGE